jgi:probable biosynthetic protein (TIGR04099 family)
LEPYILLGMPHLTPYGLSETWLMKELGHRHWLMLALRLGMDDADFRTSGGQEAYASICASSLQEHGEGLHAAKANAVLEIRSYLSILPRSRHSSRHEVACNGHMICDVELVSTFVSREKDGDNHSLARMEQAMPWPLQAVASELSITASIMRKSASVRQMSGATDGATNFQASFTPDPQQDFNGAGLLYFANFQAFFSRAVARPASAPTRLRRREIFFFGNIHSGENITISALAASSESPLLQDMVREDGKIIATCRTWS